MRPLRNVRTCVGHLTWPCEEAAMHRRPDVHPILSTSSTVGDDVPQSRVTWSRSRFVVVFGVAVKGNGNPNRLIAGQDWQGNFCGEHLHSVNSFPWRMGFRNIRSGDRRKHDGPGYESPGLVGLRLCILRLEHNTCF